MAPSQGRENVAVFNPLVLALPDWHPDGPDGAVDGFTIPFVFPAANGEGANREARITVTPTDDGWHATPRSVQGYATTADQARAIAGAWIRAAEVLDNVTAPRRVLLGEGQADVEHLDDKPAAGQRAGCPACSHGTCTLHSDEVKPT